MTETPQTWHYGLIARYWAEHNTEGPEIAYFQKKIERYGGRALDAGCGTGRLLIPFLRAGLDMDGCDVSQDMLDLCQEKAEAEGFAPCLYRQALHELRLPRLYQTIVACGAWGIGVSRELDYQALQRFYHQLKPGGVLLLDNHLPYQDAKEWQYWLKEGRADLPKPWPDSVGKVLPEDGSDYELFYRPLGFDPLNQRITRQMRALQWRDGEVVLDQEYILYENQYFYHELRSLLERAGFTVEAVESDYTETSATPESDVIVFIARKLSEVPAHS